MASGTVSGVHSLEQSLLTYTLKGLGHILRMLAECLARSMLYSDVDDGLKMVRSEHSMIWESVEILAGGLTGVGACGQLYWGPSDPPSNGWKQWMIRLIAAVGGVQVFETFFRLCSCFSIKGRALFCNFSFCSR